MKATIIKKSDLHDHILKPGAKGLVLVCRVCGNEFSANHGDYWCFPDDHEFHCCNKPMLLGRFMRTFKRQLV